MARRRSRRKSPLIKIALFCAAFTVAVLLCLQVVLFFRSDRGRAWLLVTSGQEATPRASELLTGAVRTTLRVLGAGQREMSPSMDSDAFVHWDYRLPPTVSLTQANYALATAIEQVGGHVWTAAERHGDAGDTLEMRFGLGREPTHRVLFAHDPDEAPARRARLAVVLEDADPGSPDLLAPRALLSSYLELKEPLNFGVIPTEGARDHTDAIAAAACEVLLYLPMESKGRATSGRMPEAVEVSMQPDQIRRRVSERLDEVSHVAGVVNYQGQLATQDRIVMRAVLEETQSRGLYFLDAGTSDRSEVRAAAVEVGAPCLSGTFRLDQGGGSAEAIESRLEQAGDQAEHDGGAVVMARMTPEVLAALKAGLPRLRARGIQVVKASDLVRLGN